MSNTITKKQILKAIKETKLKEKNQHKIFGECSKCFIGNLQDVTNIFSCIDLKLTLADQYGIYYSTKITDCFAEIPSSYFHTREVKI